VGKDVPYSQCHRNYVNTILHQESDGIDTTIANAFRAAWQQGVLDEQKRDRLRDDIEIWNLKKIIEICGGSHPSPNLGKLPIGSWFLQFTFTLAKPYISRDDAPAYIIDNPVSKDHVFGLPIIRPSSWKGNLRSAFRLGRGWEDKEPALVSLFGNSKGAESDFHAGRLQFYPTFFTRIGLEIINPHDRARKVGKNPILFECVPAGAKGTFSLLYVPFDLIGQPEEEIREQVAEDLQIVAGAVKEMMLTYGFSAKRTSGYGTARDEIDGVVRTRADGKKVTRLSQLAQEVANVQF